MARRDSQVWKRSCIQYLSLLSTNISILFFDVRRTQGACNPIPLKIIKTPHNTIPPNAMTEAGRSPKTPCEMMVTADRGMPPPISIRRVTLRRRPSRSVRCRYRAVASHPCPQLARMFGVCACVQPPHTPKAARDRLRMIGGEDGVAIAPPLLPQNLGASLLRLGSPCRHARMMFLGRRPGWTRRARMRASASHDEFLVSARRGLRPADSDRACQFAIAQPGESATVR